MPKFPLLIFALASGFLLSACSKSVPLPPQSNRSPCQPEKISVSGYTDQAEKLANCFVQYPGEPTREDKSYFIVEDICGQFTSDFVAKALTKPIFKIKAPEISSLYNCSYYYDNQDNYVMLSLEYLDIVNQKKGHEILGRKVEASSQIPMNNYVVYQPDGLINTIYLVLWDKKFIAINRSFASALSADDLINFAANIAQEIKTYK